MADAWQEMDGALVREYDRGDFDGALALVTAVAEVARELDHHPDVDIRWGRVTFRLSTHSTGAITAKDHELARRIDDLAH